MAVDFARALADALRVLPGPEAQRRLAPVPRAGWTPEMATDTFRPAAALLLLYPQAGAWHVPLTVRAETLRQHTGQIALPGGAIDAGENAEAAALREAEEELGVRSEDVQLVGRLTPLPIPVSRYVLQPVVGVAAARPAFRPAPGEVAEVLEVPVSLLQHPATVKRDRDTRLHGGARVLVDVPYFDVHGRRLWGATAMVMAEFLAVLSTVGEA